eukprot:TRINITY_DN6052_c0_g2_i5.p1 TRINITY_DN6052_c0_g2~~TRINITY_DN6052_c0_g2_i5.p1  ORF type:complete len:363 (-),score=71.39 TRINITY_DN6052_c0_g2_i5:77-1165(-)
MAKCKTPIIEYLMQDYPQEARYPNNEFDDLLILACRPDYLPHEMRFGNSFDPPSIETIHLLTNDMPNEYISRKFIRRSYNYEYERGMTHYDRRGIGKKEGETCVIHIPSMNIIRPEEYTYELLMIMDLNGPLNYLKEPFDERNLRDVVPVSILIPSSERALLRISCFTLDYSAPYDYERYNADDDDRDSSDCIWDIQEFTPETIKSLADNWHHHSCTHRAYTTRTIFDVLLEGGNITKDVLNFFLDHMSEKDIIEKSGPYEIKRYSFLQLALRKPKEEDCAQYIPFYQFTVSKAIIEAGGSSYTPKLIETTLDEFHEFYPPKVDGVLLMCIEMLKRVLGDEFTPNVSYLIVYAYYILDHLLL